MTRAIKLSSKFSISVPKQVREQENWRKGQEFVFLRQGKNIVLVPIPRSDELFGTARGAPRQGYCARKNLN